MSAAFDHHEETYAGAAKSVNREISAIKACEGDRVQQKQAARRARAALQDATEALRHMDMESRQQGPSEKQRMQAKIRTYRNDITTLKKDLTREELLGERQEQYDQQRGGGSYGKLNGGQRDRLDATSARLDGTTATLHAARQQVAETEGIATGVSDNLRSQREQLLNAHGRVRETTQYTQDARSVLKAMGRRAITNKIVLWLVILALFAAIIAVADHKFGSKHSGSTPTPAPTTTTTTTTHAP